jgi:cobalamin synthase
MSQLDEEERQRILESSPVGTFALLAAVIVFIPRGIIN